MVHKNLNDKKQKNMTPQAFIAHWQNNKITERAGAQQHFNDLCEMLGMENPAMLKIIPLNVV